MAKVEFKEYTGKHYALMSIENVSAIKQKRFGKDFGIEIIPYTPLAPDHPEVHVFLNTLMQQVKQVRDSIKPPVPGPVTPLEDLAAEVRTWLEAVRYELSEPQQYNDRTIEMLAALDQGTIKQRVLVRCIGGEITARDVDALDEVLDRKTPQGWLISDKRVSDRARARTAEDDAIRVFNLSEFLRQMVWGPYFDALTSLVNQDRIPDLYVDLACFKQEMVEEGREIKRDRFASLDAYIDSWLTERGKMHISLLGEFGAGKTWFCRHYAYRQLERYLKDPAKERLPLLISLRNFAKALTVQQLINDALLEQYRLPFVGSAFEVFQEMNRRGKLLLILDGFDEMARQVDYQTIVDNFWELANLVDESSKVILTSRTEYFRWAKETERILVGTELGRRTILFSPPQFEVLYLEPFSDDQIREVIKRRLGKVEGSVMAERILRTRNLAEMARKPVVVELLLAVVDEVSAAVLKNPAQVYLHATNKLLLRNIDTRRTFTSTADKLYFLCELAWEMIKGNEWHLHYGAIPERISAYFGDRIKDQHELDMWDYDLRNQTLLHRDAAGYYEFAHKSLAEYFVAFKFAVELGCLTPLFRETYCEDDGQPCDLAIGQKDFIGLTHTFGAMPLSNVQMYATVSLLREMIAEDAEGRLWEIVDGTKRKTPEQVQYVGGNAATLLNRMGESFARRNLRAAVLTGAMLYGADLTDSDLSGAFLDNTLLVLTCLKRVQCIDTSFRNATLISTMLEQSSFEGVDFTDAALEYSKNIFTISYSADGLRIAGGGDPGNITIWDSRSGREILNCRGHNGSIQTVVFSPLGEFLASGGSDEYVRLWDALTGNEIWSQKLHEDYVRGLSFDPTGQWLASVGDDGRLIIWEARTGEGHLHLIEPSGLLCVSFSPNGDLLGIGSRDGSLMLWDPRIRSEMGRWQVHEEVHFVAFSAGSSLLISGGVEPTDRRRRREVASIKVWEAPMWQNRLSIDFDHTGGWLHGSVSPREPYVAGQTGTSTTVVTT